MANYFSQRLSVVGRSIALASSLAVLQLSLLMAAAVADDDPTAPTMDDHGSSGPTSHDEGEHSTSTGAVNPDTLKFKDPTWLAEMALVHVETGATARLSFVYAGRYFQMRVRVPAGPTTSRTGFYVDPGSADGQLPPYLITSTALSRESLEVWAINSTFQKLQGFTLPPDIDDMYARTHADDPSDDQLLQDCYDWRTTENPQCSVWTRLNRFVIPYTEDSQQILITDHRQDELIQFFAYQCGDTCGQAPTIGISPPEQLGEKWWAVGFSPGKPDPVSVQVTLDDGVTEDSESLLTPDEAARVAHRLGRSAAGSPVISERGYVIGLLVNMDDNWSVVPAHHLLEDAATKGVRTLENQIMHHLRNGLSDYEHGEFEHAEGAYFNDETLERTGYQTAVVKLADLVAARAAANPDGEADSSHSATTVDESRTVWPWVVAAAVIAGLAALWFGIQHRRSPRASGASRLSPPPPVGSERPGAPSAAPIERPATASRPVSAASDTSGASDAPSREGGEQPSQTTQYCPSCGAQLSPGDRFCFSCGTPSR